jgi:hypothetical protein
MSAIGELGAFMARETKAAAGLAGPDSSTEPLLTPDLSTGSTNGELVAP